MRRCFVISQSLFSLSEMYPQIASLLNLHFRRSCVRASSLVRGVEGLGRIAARLQDPTDSLLGPARCSVPSLVEKSLFVLRASKSPACESKFRVGKAPLGV
jgi:hypothetical protein